MTYFIRFREVRNYFDHDFTINFFRARFRFERIIGVTGGCSILMDDVIFFDFPDVDLFVRMGDDRYGFEDFSLDCSGYEDGFRFRQDCRGDSN